MAEFRWIKMFSFIILMLQLTAAQPSEFVVRDGDEVTLSCGNLKDDHDKCNRTTWLCSNSIKRTAAPLFEYGKIHKDAQNKSDRLSVTANCSLVIKKVTAEDAGRYTCRKFNKSGKQEGSDSEADLSVVNMTEHKDDNTVTLTCSVLTYPGCKYTVKWLHEDQKDLRMSQSTCSASLTFTTSDYIHTSNNYELLTCQVTDGKTVLQFPFRTQPLDKKTGWWWWLIIVAVGLVALIVSAALAIRWRRSKGNKENTDLNPVVAQSAPETIQNSADPEDAISYASVNHIKNTNCKAQIWGKDSHEEVTYSVVKSPATSAGALTDPSKLYDII